MEYTQNIIVYNQYISILVQAHRNEDHSNTQKAEDPEKPSETSRRYVRFI